MRLLHDGRVFPQYGFQSFAGAAVKQRRAEELAHLNREGAGAVIGSISTTVSANRATDEYRQYLIKEMIAAANTFSNKLRDLKT